MLENSGNVWLTVDTCLLGFDSVLDWYELQQMWDKVIFENLFMLIYCPDW